MEADSYWHLFSYIIAAHLWHPWPFPYDKEDSHCFKYHGYVQNIIKLRQRKYLLQNLLLISKPTVWEFSIYLLIKLCYMTCTGTKKSEKWLFTFLVSNLKVDRENVAENGYGLAKYQCLLSPQKCLRIPVSLHPWQY